MLSMKNISAGGARKYYESAQGEYYNKDSNTTEWQGKIAIELGLADKNVDFNDFEKLSKGHDLSNKKLVKSAYDKKHRAGMDLTFSAPKSVSILSLVDEKILSAHQEAVKSTLDYIESGYIQTRIMNKGEKTIEDTQKIIVAKFEHHANRNQEPQLHTHCVVMNLTKDSHNRYKTIHNDIFYQDQKDLGQLYRSELAKNLVEKGYAIEITDQAQGFFKLQGVSNDIIRAFSTRSDEIGVRANELRMSHKNARKAKINEMATLDTRTAKTKSLSNEEMRESVDKILQKHDTSLSSLANEISNNKISNEIPLEKDTNSYIKEAIYGIEENKSAWKKSEVLAHSARLSIGKCSIAELDQSFKKYINDNHLSFAGVKKCNKYYSSVEMKTIETNIVNLVKAGKDKSEIQIDKNELEKFITNDALNLTPGQKDALSLITTSKDKVVAIQGDAGTGKTFVMNIAREIFEQNGFIVKGFAPTGKAVQELVEGAKIETRTISSYLLERSTDKKQDQTNSKDQNSSTQEEEKPIPKGEVWIIDEAGMIGSKKIEQILALSNTNEIDTKIVLVGDKKQFESIDQGKFFKDLQKTGDIHFAEMKDNKRQNTEHTKAIVKCFNDYIQQIENDDKNKKKGFDQPDRAKKKDEHNKHIEEAFAILKTSNSIYEFKDEGEKRSKNDGPEKKVSARLEAITSQYLNSIENGKSTLIITRTNDERMKINETIRDELKNKNTLSNVGYLLPILSSVGLSGVKKMYAESYQEGNIVFFQHELGDIARGTKGEIIGVNPDRNTIGITYESDSKENGKETKTIALSLNSAKAANSLQVFTRESREFCIGDKIIFSKNDKRLDVKNGQIGTIEKIDNNGDCVVKIGEKQVEFNLKNQGKVPYQYIDHAYAITDYKSQGASVDTLIWSVQSGEANIHSGYVALTRAKETIKIFTDSIDGLKKSIVQQSTKTSYLELQNDKKLTSKISEQTEKEIFKMPTLSNDFKELEQSNIQTHERGGYSR